MNELYRIRIGNQTSFAAAFPTEPFEFAVAEGFNAFEWFPDKDETGKGFDIEGIAGETRDYIRDIAFSHDIALSVHAPLDIDLMEPLSRKGIWNVLGFMRDIGAVLMNIHLVGDKGMKDYLRAVAPLIMDLAGSGIRLAIENTPLTGPREFNELFALLRDWSVMDAEHVGMCLDLGHANLHHATRNDYLAFVDSLHPDIPIIHVHMHENYGEADTHLPLFHGPAGLRDDGIRGFLKRLMERNFSGSLILEQWPRPPSLLKEARDRLTKIIDEIFPRVTGGNSEERG